ncbi:hypothetical protein [Amycolatopsis sp. CA-128772]|uniref:hypothetical protein n=1 Tax=Amycolatopsis sp. CA-128772 TaxID=2073159 RepID=UPI001E5D4303|nr:hypothetical protein [Amycolatopsis sp. CA-128772]
MRELKLRLAVGPPPAEEGHADRVSAQALGQRLDRAPAALRARERDVLLLIAAERLGYQDVADALGIRRRHREVAPQPGSRPRPRRTRPPRPREGDLRSWMTWT